MEQTILTQEQKKALEVLSGNEEIMSLFYFTGGTALAEFYLHHRYSDDLDFFTKESGFPQLSVEALVQKIKETLAMDKVEYRRIHDRRIFFFKREARELKMEFSYYPFAQLKSPQKQGGIPADSLEDLAANKLMALMDRIEPKDFVDIFFILKEGHLTLNELLVLVKKKFDLSFDPVTIGSELAKVKNIEALPRMIKPLSPLELKDFFSRQAKTLAGEIFS